MKRFAALFAELDASTSTAAKLAALQSYLAQADALDAAWAVYFLAGGKPKRLVRTALLRELAGELAGLPGWLFEASYQAVGDLAETVAQVLPPSAGQDDASLSQWVSERLLPLRGLSEPEQRLRIATQWQQLDRQGVFLWVKLAGGGFRVGVSRLLVQRALAEHADVPPGLIAQRMMGYTDGSSRPDAPAYLALIAPVQEGSASPAGPGQPYPFFLAHALPAAPAEAALGRLSDWQIEWKYDGIRAQLVRRAGQSWLWSRGEELIGESFPDVLAQAQSLPQGTVLDGELLVWQGQGPAPFSVLQQRLGRKRVPAALLASAPAVFVAYDLLEQDGQDLRSCSLRERRARLEQLLQGQAVQSSDLLQADQWAELDLLRQGSRERGVEGLMLKQLDSRYGAGRVKGEGLWFKWKSEPMVVDGVLIYAQAGHGRRAGLFSDYTFGVWNRPPMSAQEAQAVVEAIARREALPVQPGLPLAEQPLQLVAFAKAYSGLSDRELSAVDAVVARTTVDKFGPVRSVRPSLVFELAFEGIVRSSRHKSGIALRFPRIARQRPDKPLHEAGTLADLQALLQAAAGLSSAADEGDFGSPKAC
ncbi:MAG: cisplatin damage response ATP-dependent DNA ligase [Betaproteobacteria bacterium]